MSAWPAVVDRLVSVTLPGLFASAAGWSQGVVYDGPPVTADAPTSFVTVGFVLGEDNGGSYEQTYALGGLLEEAGTVLSEVVCATGDVDLPTVRARAFALVDAWQAAISADGSLGGVVASASLAVDVLPAQTTAGAEQRLTVTLSYFARGL